MHNPAAYWRELGSGLVLVGRFQFWRTEHEFARPPSGRCDSGAKIVRISSFRHALSRFWVVLGLDGHWLDSGWYLVEDTQRLPMTGTIIHENR